MAAAVALVDAGWKTAPKMTESTWKERIHVLIDAMRSRFERFSRALRKSLLLRS